MKALEPLLTSLQNQVQPPSEVPGLQSPPQGAGTAETGTPSGAPPPPADGPSLTQPLMVFGLFFIFMWFVLIRPERKRSKERAAMLSQVGKGDTVVTTGGMHGQVVRVEDKTLTLKVDDNVRLKFDRNAVARVASSTNKSADKEKVPAKA